MGDAEFQRLIPGAPPRRQQIGRAIDRLNTLGRNRQPFVDFRRGVIRSSPVIPDDPQHVLVVFFIPFKGPQLPGYLSRSGIGLSRHDRRDGPANRQRFWRVVGNALAHEDRAQVGVAEPQGPELKTLFGNGPAGKRRHEHADFQHNGPESHRVPEVFSLEPPVWCKELAEIQRRKITRRVIEVHVF